MIKSKRSMTLKKKAFALALSMVLTAGAISAAILFSNKPLPANADIGPAVLERGDGYNLRFKANEQAIRYVIHDATDYRDGLVLTNEDRDANGYLYYQTETVGVHEVTVTTEYSSGSFTSNALTITNKPMFFYGLHSGLYFYDVDDPSASGVYSILQEDGSYLKVSQSDYDSTYIHNKMDALDFSDAAHVDEVIRINKQLGANILFLSNRVTNVESNNYWFFPGSFENSVCKRFMDAAWAAGMKCIITDFNIIVNNESGDTTIINQRLASTGLRQALLHPAFYGLQFKDEPGASAIHNVGLSVKAIMDYWRNDAELSKKPVPFIHTDLRSYDENRSAEYGYFEDKEAYKAYIKSWITETGLDYVSSDTYTYSTRYYGTKSFFGTKYYYDPSKVIYDAINEAKAELGIDFKVYQTLTGSTDTSRKSATHQYDVFSSTFLAVGEDVDGYSVYELTDGQSAKSTAMNRDFEFTDTYSYLESANKQYRKIQSLLEGYEAGDKVIEINGNYSSNRLYGRGLRTITTTFSKGSDSYQFIANFESDATVVSKTVNVPDGRLYYLFGYGKETYQRVGDGSDISLNNGEAILISSKSASEVSDVSFDKGLLCDYDVVTIRDVAGREAIGNVGEGTSSIAQTDIYDNVHSDNNSVAIRFLYYAEHLDASSWGNNLADIYVNKSWDAYGFSIGANGGDVHNKISNSIARNVLQEKTDNLVEVGAIKIKGTKKAYAYIKVNDALVIEDVLDNLSNSNKVNFYISDEAKSVGGVILKSVDLPNNKPHSGAIGSLSGSEIRFKAKYGNDIPYGFADGSKDAQIIPTDNPDVNYLKKVDGLTYAVYTDVASSAGATIDLSGHYYAYVDGHKYSFYVDEGSKLCFNGTDWISIGELDLVEPSMTLAYSCEFRGEEIRNDHFFLRMAIKDEHLASLSDVGTVGIAIASGSKTKYYPLSGLHEDGAKETRYLTLDLGAALSENHQMDVFKICAYLEVAGNKILSKKVASGSIYSLVGELYADEATRNSVARLYEYLYH